MFGLTSHIELIIAALLILGALLLSGSKIYMISQPNKRFRSLLWSGVLTCIIGIIYCALKGFPDIFGPTGYVISRFLYSLSAVALEYLFYMYIRSYSRKAESYYVKTWSDYVATLTVDATIVLFGVNCFTGFISYMDENGVVVKTSAFYIITYLILAIIPLLALINILDGKKHMTKFQFDAIAVSLVCCIFFFILEYVSRSTYPVLLFGFALSMIFIQTSLESPEHAKMNAAINELNLAKDAMADLNSEAAAANKVKEEFLGKVAYEIRTPMSAILGMNELIMRETSEDSIRAYAAQAFSSGTNLLHMVDDMLSLSGLKSGKLKLVEDEYSIVNVLRDVWSVFNEKTKEKGQQLIFDIDKMIPSRVFGDGNKIHEILLTLLSNAVEFNDKCTITLKLTLESCDEVSAIIKYSISDDGTGIKNENIPKLFNPFDHYDESEGKWISGIGLGLNLTSELLKLMDSSLEISSAWGSGSEFSFTLQQEVRGDELIGEWHPGSFVAVEKESRELIIAPAAAVMVVDDSEPSLTLFKSLLRDTKIEVVAASSGAEALEFSLIKQFDAIFLDHMMPEMNGIETLHGLRAEGSKNINTPVVALTANAVSGAYEMYISEGFDDVLFKPYGKEEINKYLWKLIPIEHIENI